MKHFTEHGMVKDLLRCAPMIAVIFLLAGCASVRGTPKSFLSVPNANSEEVVNVAMRELANSPTAGHRNMNLARAMADVDILYVQYRDEFLRADNTYNASIDILSLMSDLAGRMTDRIGVKDNYLTLGALLSGTRATVNNRFLYAQTSLALIKGMDAARAATALSIKEKQSTQLIEEYSGRDAYADVLTYYFSGTLAGGLIWLQSNATQVEADKIKEIATLRVPTPEELKARESLYADIAPRLLNRVAVARALNAWSISVTGDESIELLQEKFSNAYRDLFDSGMSEEQMRAELVKANFFED